MTWLPGSPCVARVMKRGEWDVCGERSTGVVEGPDGFSGAGSRPMCSMHYLREHDEARYRNSTMKGEQTMAAKKKSKDWDGAVAASNEKTTGEAHRTESVMRRRFHQKLPCSVGREEVEAKAANLAKAVHEREAVRVQKREANARFREQIHYYDELVDTLATEVDLKSDSRNVECTEELTPQNEIVTIRCDTKEVLSKRAATSAELQQDMFGSGAAAPNGKGGKKEKGKRAWSEGKNPKPSNFDEVAAEGTE
jgi:hypothetical protein